jgi:hypothetical protein
VNLACPVECNEEEGEDYSRPWDVHEPKKYIRTSGMKNVERYEA